MTNNTTRLKKIFLYKENYKSYKTDDVSENSLDKLNKINIFVGANNAGKSRFLRSLFTDKEFPYELNTIDLSKLREVLKELLSSVNIIFHRSHIADSSNEKIKGVKAVLTDFIKRFEKFEFNKTNTLVEDFNNFWENLLVYHNQGGSYVPGYISTSDWSLADASIRYAAQEKDKIIKEIIPQKLDYQTERIYIPILRGLRPTQMMDEIKFDELKDNYRFRTVKDYFAKEKVLDSEIFTGLRLYQDLKIMLLGKREEREKVRQFEIFLSRTFF